MKTESGLQELGKKLGMVDRHLVALLAQRMELAKDVERYKRTHDQPIIRSGIEEKRLKAMQVLAGEKGLDPNFLRSIFYFIITESCRVQIDQLQTNLEIEKLSPQRLKENLLALTKEIAPLYDKTYGLDFFATKNYLAFEESFINQEIKTLKSSNDLDLAIDLGCATGRIAFRLAESFTRVVGYDISPDMIQQAKAKLKVKDRDFSKIDFMVADIEEGIPEADNSVSLVVMNLGTASDVIDIQRVLTEIHRILKPNGRFVLSFYNANALLYACWFIPWPVSLAATVKPINKSMRYCLDVHLRQKVFSVYARPYAIEEVKELLEQNSLTISRILTYPTVSSILPNEFFEEEHMQKLINKLDLQLTKLETGAYILVSGRKAISSAKSL